MPRLVGEARRHFLLDASFPPDRATNMPFAFFCAEICCQSCRNVFDGIPNRHQFHVLDRWVFYSRVVTWPVFKAAGTLVRREPHLDTRFVVKREAIHDVGAGPVIADYFHFPPVAA